MEWKEPSLRWVSTETTRHITRYTPAASGFRAMANRVGSPGTAWA